MLTMAGLEVSQIQRLGAGLEGVVVAKVLRKDQHPNADRLSVVLLDRGGETLTVVCGATNFQAGDLVALATVGSTLPGGKRIEAATLRGVQSFGMLCSEAELGIGTGASGLFLVPASASPGTPLQEALGLDDVILELNVTPNRGDALSHLGIAREVAALQGSALKVKEAPSFQTAAPASGRVRIQIEDATRCWRYCAKVVEDVAVGPSPSWLIQRLDSCGMRGINNVVDVTNYVMLEAGHPLHAFDLDAVRGGTIVLRTARAQERITTLDQVDRALASDDLVVCDGAGPLVIAGVLGGATAEVSTSTRHILLEAAAFCPSTVRRSRKRHGLATESSFRFERGIDIDAIPRILDRAASLLVEIAGGRVLSGTIDAYPTERPRRTVVLRDQAASDVLGMPVGRAEANRVLNALGFKEIESHGDAVRWSIPSFRNDVAIEEDLVEEIARIRGYDAIPITPLRTLMPRAGGEARASVEEVLRASMCGLGFDEVVNYSFVSPSVLEAAHCGAGAIRIANPLSTELSAMRTSLIPSLIGNLIRATRYGAQGIRIFELAKTYASRSADQGGDTPASERLSLCGLLWGRPSGERNWIESRATVDFYDAKAAVETILRALRVSNPKFIPHEGLLFHPRRAAGVQVGETSLGVLGELHPEVRDALQAPAGTHLFELDVTRLRAHARTVDKAQALQRFPSVLRDLAVVVDAATPAERVRTLILEAGKGLLARAEVFDVYAGSKLGEGKKSLAFALTYEAKDRTLQEEEVAEVHGEIVAKIGTQLGGTLRGSPSEASP